MHLNRELFRDTDCQRSVYLMYGPLQPAYVRFWVRDCASTSLLFGSGSSKDLVSAVFR